MIEYEAFIGPAVVGLAAWVGVKVAIAKITQRMDDRDRAEAAADVLRQQAQDVKAGALEAHVASTARALQASVTASAVALAESMTQRHIEYCRRFDGIEKKIGVTNGGSFVDRDFCREVHRGTTSEVAALQEQVRKASEKADEACEVARQEAKEIKDRLTEVELSFKHHTHS